MKKIVCALGALILMGVGCQSNDQASFKVMTLDKEYHSIEHGFSLKYPSNLAFHEVLPKEVGIKNYLAIRFIQANGDELQMYVNPGGHGPGPCGGPGNDTPVTDSIRTIGGMRVAGQYEEGNFEKNVLYHYMGDKLIIGKFCGIAKEVKFIMNGGNHKLSGFSTYPFHIFGNGWEKVATMSPAEVFVDYGIEVV